MKSASRASTKPGKPSYKLLVFGSTGAIGSALIKAGVKRGWTVVAASRKGSKVPDASSIRVDPFGGSGGEQGLTENGPYNAVCWAQGSNTNDSVFNVDLDSHLELYRANCLYILATLKALLAGKLLRRPARLCVVSSIWQVVARQEKLSYSMTKAALQGLVSSASTDLAAEGHLLNAVLPGAVDTPMTRSLLTNEQIMRLENATLFHDLPKMEDVTSLIAFLCSSDNTGITGQFIAADLGMSRVHLL